MPHCWSNRRPSAAAIVLLSLACTHQLAAEPTASPTSQPQVFASESYLPPEDTREILKIDPEMRRYFADWVTAPSGTEARLRQLVEAVVLPKGLHFAYDAEATFDARTTFRLRRGNCVGFSILMVAMAREFGFDTFFQNVAVPEHWDRFGEVIASVQHINVRVMTEDGEFVVDLRPDIIPHADVSALRIIRDNRAFAEFYNDIGFFRLVHGDTKQALYYMTVATTVDSGCASAWANRATLHMRLGDLPTARTCFERALRIDGNGMTALSGFVALLHAQGSPDDLRRAGKLEGRAKRLQDRNPYYQEHLAEVAEQSGDLVTAERLYRRAVDLKDDDPELWAEWASALQKLGRTEDARHANAKLDKLRAWLASRPVYTNRD